MKDEVIALAEQINMTLLEIPEIKEYLRLQELYNKDEQVQLMVSHLKDSNITKEEYNRLIKEYVRNPLVNNYLQARQEALDIINSIKGLIK